MSSRLSFRSQYRVHISCSRNPQNLIIFSGIDQLLSKKHVWKMHVLFLCGSKTFLLLSDVLLCTQNTAKDVDVCFLSACFCSVKLTSPTLPDSQYHLGSTSTRRSECCLSLLDQKEKELIACAVSPLPTKITG